MHSFTYVVDGFNGILVFLVPLLQQLSLRATWVVSVDDVTQHLELIGWDDGR